MYLSLQIVTGLSGYPEAAIKSITASMEVSTCELSSN